jgi:hypothetical protein
MFERFSDASRRVILLARDEARGLDHRYVGTEHLLLGVLDAGDSPAADRLYDLGVTDEAVREGIEQWVGRGGTPSGDDIAFSSRAKAAIEVALRTAERHAAQVEPSHLLLGVLNEHDSPACGILNALGVDVVKLGLELIHEVGEPTGISTLLKDAETMARAMRPLWSLRRSRAAGVEGLELLDRMSDAVLTGIVAARREARRLGWQRLGPELLVLGLLVVESEAREALIGAGAGERPARAVLEAICPVVDTLGDGPLPLDDAVRWALGHSRRPDACLRSLDLLQAVLARSLGVWILLRAAGAEPAALRKLAGYA